MSPTSFVFMLSSILFFAPTHARNPAHPCGRQNSPIAGPASILYYDCSLPGEKNLVMCPPFCTFVTSKQKCVHNFVAWNKCFIDLKDSKIDKSSLLEHLKKHMKPHLLNHFRYILNVTEVLLENGNLCSAGCQGRIEGDCIIPYDKCDGYFNCSNFNSPKVSCGINEKFDKLTKRCASKDSAQCGDEANLPLGGNQKLLFCSSTQMDECLNKTATHDCIFSTQCMSYQDCSREADERSVRCQETLDDRICKVLFSNGCEDLPELLDEITSGVTIKYQGPPFKEGHRAVVVCDSNITSIERFAWILNNNEIEGSERIKITNEQKKSILTFDPILQTDAGYLVCSVEYGKNFHQIDGVSLVVHSPPLISISPSQLTSASHSGRSSFTCNVTIPNSHYYNSLPTSIDWLANESLVSTSEFTYISHQNLLLEETSAIQCCIKMPVFDAICSKPSYVTLTQEDETKTTCKSEVIDGFLWRKSKVGENFNLPCPNLQKGKMTKTCLEGGTWDDDTDDDECLIIEMDLLGREIDKLGTSRNSMKLTRLTQRLPNVSNTNNFNILKNMSAILFSVSSLRKIAEGGKMEASMETRNVLTSLVGVLQSKAWKSKNSLRRPSLQLMQTLNVYSSHKWRDEFFTISFTSANNVLEFARDRMSDEDSEAVFPLSTKSRNQMKIFKGDLFQKLGRNTSIPIGASLLKGVADCLMDSSNISKINSDLITMDVLVPPQFHVSTEFTLQHLQTLEGYTPSCVYWKFRGTLDGYWSSEGCAVTAHNRTSTTCRCSHLTNFAILFSPTSAGEKHNLILGIISIIGCTISIVALILTIILYALKWRLLQSKRAVLLMNLCSSLIIANVIFLAGVNQTSNPTGCTAVAILLHYFFLASFSMMFLLALHLFISVFFVFFVFTRKHVVALVTFGWLTPVIVVGISMAATQLKGYGGTINCWLSLEDGVLWAFAAPSLFIIAVNMVIATSVLIKICSMKISQINLKRSKWISAAQNIVVLNPLLGLSWIFGVLSVNQELVVFQYIFAITNSLQGLFIFLLHGICLKKNLSNQTQRLKQDKTPRGHAPDKSTSSKPSTSLTGLSQDLKMMKGEDHFVLENETLSSSFNLPLQHRISTDCYSTDLTNINSPENKQR